MCTPLRRSRSSADGWDLKFFLPLWKSGLRGGVAMATATPPRPLLLTDARMTRVLFYCHVMDPSSHRHAHRSPHLASPSAISSSLLVGWESFCFKLLGSRLSFCGFLGGGVRWWDLAALPPWLFCLSETCTWSCYSAGWLSGHRGDNAGCGMGCVVFVLAGVDG